MTFDGLAAVAWAKSQVGFREGHNNQNPYSLWQYGNAYNPWCASFQSMAQYEGGYRFVGCTYGERGEAYTPTEKLRAQQQGTWRDKNWRAAPGDAVLFDWGNNGLIDHVELVVFDDGNRIITIGGNTSDSVLYRTRDRQFVAGFWAVTQDASQAPAPVDLAAIKKITDWRNKVAATPLHEGDHGNTVAILNQLLIALGWMVEPKNMNVYGKPTVAGVRHMKTALKFDDKDGKKFGGPAADALLAPH